MPEIAEIARIVHFLRLHLVGKTIANVVALDDSLVFKDTSGSDFASALTGRRVLSAFSKGKYFGLVLDRPPHPVMHFGMSGWIHIKGDQTAYTNYYKRMKEAERERWPPKFWKWQLETADPGTQVAFTDPRRFGRIRLVDCPGDSIRNHSPLAENGPDPVVDLDLFTEDYMRSVMRSRRVPVKALLLDQAFVSGIGNWVADEVLYQARLHPEQYCNDFQDDEIRTLHKAVRYVCQLAVDKLGDSSQFPPHFIFHVRWGKGKKAAPDRLPSGEKLAFLTVGGRTSCYVPELQKKTGRLVPGIKEESTESGAGEKRKLAWDTERDEEAEECSTRGKRRKTGAPARRLTAQLKSGDGTLVEDSSRRRSSRLRTR